MVEEVTKGIKISVNTDFRNSFYKNHQVHFWFGYNITIENQSLDSVQLQARHWEIYDALNYLEIVKGEGVIGKKPILQPGESHTYTSGCILGSPVGAMKGFYKMINLNNTKPFFVSIPLFRLNAPIVLN